MFVKQLSLSNFQNIAKFEATFNGNIYLITGENEIGKSTFLKAIAILLTGNRDEVLATDAEKGFAKAVVGDNNVNYEVELRFTKANPRGTLTIKQQGTDIGSDRISALQSIFGYQEFDAEEFIRWSETAEGRRKQVEIVKSLMPNEAQERLIAIDKDILSLEEKRLQDGRELKVFDGIVKGLEKEVSVADMTTYAKPVVLQELIDKKTQIVTIAEQYKGVKERMEAREKEVATIPDAIEKAKSDFKTLEKESQDEFATLQLEFNKKAEAISKRINDAREAVIILIKEKEDSKVLLETQIAKAKKYIAETVVPSAEEVQTEIDNAQTHNDKHKKVLEYVEQKKKFDEITKKVASHQTSIDSLKSEKEAVVKSAKLPIEGLSFSEDGLVLNGLPFAHGKVSTSQEMEVAAKLIIAKNPTTKVFRVARGESLGQAKFDALVAFAKKEGFQGFIEQVVRGQNDLQVNEYNEGE